MSPRRAPAWCLALFVAYLAGAFLLHASAIVPWEIVVVLLHGGSLLIWVGAGGRVRDLFSRGGASLRLLLLAAALAIGTGVLTLAARHLLGLRELVAPTAPSDVLLAAAVALLVGGLFNALPEEVTLRGVFLRIFDSAWGPRRAMAASGILFALAHLPIAILLWEMTGAVLAVRLVYFVALGALLAWTVVRTGTIWVAILWHAGANLVSVTADELAASIPSLTAVQRSWDLVFVIGEAVLLWLLVHHGWSRRSG